jgi:hypothetical protein
MATIKSYTDLEQSRKLAEILPLESADMKWFFWKSDIDVPKFPTFGYSKDAAENYKSTEAVYLPCWSLSALLELMPEIHGERPKLDTGRIQTDKYYVEYPYHERTKKDWHSTELYDEPLDAAFEMICWLKENKKL